MEKRTILIANDDGIGAEGIARLAAAALPFGRVFVAAPDTQCSGMSQKLTIRGELSGRKGGRRRNAADCLPPTLLPVRLDVVLTGINRGYNAGFDIAYSGTVGAALEAVMNGVPAIAFSARENGNPGAAEAYLPVVLEALLARPTEHLWNVICQPGAAQRRTAERRAVVSTMTRRRTFHPRHESRPGQMQRRQRHPCSPAHMFHNQKSAFKTDRSE